MLFMIVLVTWQVSKTVKFEILRGLTNSLLAAKRPDEVRYCYLMECLLMHVHITVKVESFCNIAWCILTNLSMRIPLNCNYYIFMNVGDTVAWLRSRHLRTRHFVLDTKTPFSCDWGSPCHDPKPTWEEVGAWSACTDKLPQASTKLNSSA